MPELAAKKQVVDFLSAYLEIAIGIGQSIERGAAYNYPKASEISNAVKSEQYKQNLKLQKSLRRVIAALHYSSE